VRSELGVGCRRRSRLEHLIDLDVRSVVASQRFKPESAKERAPNRTDDPPRRARPLAGDPDAKQRLIEMTDRHAGRLRSELAGRVAEAMRDYRRELTAAVDEAVEATGPRSSVRSPIGAAARSTRAGDWTSSPGSSDAARSSRPTSTAGSPTRQRAAGMARDRQGSRGDLDRRSADRRQRRGPRSRSAAGLPRPSSLLSGRGRSGARRRAAHGSSRSRPPCRPRPRRRRRSG
jgi:hypothetical protein